MSGIASLSWLFLLSSSRSLSYEAWSCRIAELCRKAPHSLHFGLIFRSVALFSHSSWSSNVTTKFCVLSLSFYSFSSYKIGYCTLLTLWAGPFPGPFARKFDFLAAFEAIYLRGAFPPVDFLAVYLVLAIILHYYYYYYKLKYFTKIC